MDTITEDELDIIPDNKVSNDFLIEKENVEKIIQDDFKKLSIGFVI